MSLEDRCTDLEIQLTRQDNLIEQLNQVIYEQQVLLDQLDKRVRFLEKKDVGDIGPADEAPPHY